MYSTQAHTLSFASIRKIALALCLSSALVACGGSDNSGSPTPTYTVGGTVSGLTGTGLVLKDSISGQQVTVAAKATTFTFASSIKKGKTYNVSVLTQPTGPSQTCAVTGGSGTVGAANVTSVAVSCTTGTYTVGGTVTGLTGSGLVLKDSVSGHQVTVAASASTFTMPAVDSGASYNVAVLTQPTSPAQTCAVTGGTGTVGAANVTSVAVTCTTGTFTVGGTISGLTGTGLVLKDSVSGHQVTVLANATTFAITPAVSSGATYNVAVLTQPTAPAQTCSISSGATGTVGAANVTSVAVTCTTATFTVGGSVSGLKGTGLVLKDTVSGHTVTVAANATSFTITPALPSGSSYTVTVQTQPSSPPEVCTVGSPSGTVTVANITSVTVSCVKVGQFAWVTNPFDNNGNGSIGAFTINAATGALTAAPGFPAVSANVATTDNQPYSIVADPSGTFVYIANSGCLAFTTPPAGLPCLTAAATISINSVNADGSLNLDSSPSVVTGDVTNQPYSLVIDPAGPYLYAGSADTAGGFIEGYTITAPGTLAALTGSPYASGTNVPFSLVIDSTQSYLYSANTYDANINGYGISAGVLQTPSPCNCLGSPYGEAANPNGRFVYITDTVANTVTEFSYDITGILSAPVNTYPVGTTPQGITIDPTGKFLYVSNNADGTVSAFAVNADGSLSAITGSPFTSTTANLPSGTPTAVAVDPSSQFLYVANGDAGTMTAFKIGATGALTPVGGSLGAATFGTIIPLGGGGPSSIAIY